ncbi:MAG: hypothetical protein ACLUKN_03130 [Bacilli bacterium]
MKLLKTPWSFISPSGIATIAIFQERISLTDTLVTQRIEMLLSKLDVESDIMRKSNFYVKNMSSEDLNAE